MEIILQGANLTKRASLLIRLRWMAIVLLVGATFVASNIMGASVSQTSLYLTALALALYNAILFLSLYRITKYDTSDRDRAIGRLIVLQLSADLFILTGILYLSGGSSNPFLFYFVFYIIVAATVLPRSLSYIQATLAVVLVGVLILLEYMGLSDRGAGGFEFSRRPIGLFFAFATTLYLVVYITTLIMAQLRKQQDWYRTANEQLKEKDTVKNEYILRVTHDIKGHLAAIKSCLDIVKAGMVGSLGPRQADLVERADRRAVRCMIFITALLKLTRMRLTGALEKADFSLKNAIFDAFAAAEDRASKRGLDFTYEIDPDIDRYYGNELLIEDTITNLLLNAIKYTPAKGKVKLVAEYRPDAVLIQIKDSGIGIPKDEMGRIFDEFYRASNARKIERDGTGLGLSMAREVIGRHGGRIWAESGGTGSTFSFTLPFGLPEGQAETG